MSHRSFLLDRMEHYLRGRLAEEALHHETRFRPSLTISRQCGAGVDRISRKLVEYLDDVDDTAGHGWAFFDQSLVGKVIGDNRLPESLEPYFAEKAKFPVMEAFEQLLNLHPPDWSLFNYSAHTIRKLCRMGNAIVVGRAGNFVTADLPNTFHVRLVAPLEKRIEHTRRRYDISADEARHMVVESDRGREQFVKRYTGSGVDDPTCYHITVNSGNFTDEVLVRILADNMLEWASSKQLELESASLL